jgi:hypothetical protein
VRVRAETVRPMLLHGLPPRTDESGAAVPDGAASPHARAGLFLGRAMELLLPALDANDEEKLAAALSFYTSIFSSCVALVGTEAPGGDNGTAGARADVAAKRGAVEVGIDLDSFACDLLRRLFMAVDTLQSGKEGVSMGDDDACAPAQSSVLLDPASCHQAPSCSS